MPISNSIFTRSHDWTDDRDNSIRIRADRHDEHDGDIALALNKIMNGTAGFIGATWHYAGTVSNPGISFNGDEDTGFYRVSANTLGIATQGTLALSISDAQVVTLANALAVASGGTGAATKQGAVDSLLDGTTHVDADNMRIADQADNTKLVIFDASAITTATVRTITVPDADVNLALLDEDDFASDSATQGTTQQAAKAYSDAQRPRLVSTYTPSAVTGVNLTDLGDSWMIEGNLGSSSADEVLLLTASYDTGGSPTFETAYKYAATEITSGGTQSQVASASATSIVVSRQCDLGANDRRQFRIWSMPAPSNGSPMIGFEGCSLDSGDVLRHYQGSGIVFAGTGKIRAIRLAQGTGNLDGEINVYAMS